MIHYKVSFEQANAHLFEVKLNLNFALHKGQKFSLPNWIPGSYMIRDFARNIVSFSANCKGELIAVEKLDKSTWQLLSDVDCLEIGYQVYAWDLSVRSAHLDSQHAFFNGTSLFLEVDGYQDEVHHMILQPSSHALANNWQVATAMTAKSVDENGFGKYFSNNYAEFIDHPVEISQLKSVEFDVNGVVHKMVFTEAPENIDLARIADDVKKICAAEVEFFGDAKPPFEQYLFMTFVLKEGFGGLEHRASTALQCSYADLPLKSASKEKISEGYRGFLSLCCHEYFHNWNVKRIKPAKFLSLNLKQEVNTQLLWFFEGITSYYDELLLVRSNVISAESYLDLLARTISKVTKGKGRFKQTVTQSSFDAWTKFYKQDENAINSIVSYYTKGAVVALCLDFEIKSRTNGQKSLDDLMRLIWNRYGKTSKGLGESQVEQLAKELVGESLHDFFEQALYSTEDLDLAAVFNYYGINFQLLPQLSWNEKGGFNTQLIEREASSYLGITHKADPLGVKIHSVGHGSCALEAGLSNGDIIIAINDLRVTSVEIDKLIAEIPLGEVVKISYFRRERLYHTECQLTASDPNICYLSFKNGAMNNQFKHWVGQLES
ncbi:M61 family metallopeptidase [Aliikangiella sp. IMCC44632]